MFLGPQEITTVPNMHTYAQVPRGLEDYLDTDKSWIVGATLGPWMDSVWFQLLTYQDPIKHLNRMVASHTSKSKP